jgi:hypothetical protein
MTQEEKDGVIWWAIDDALKKASSGFINYESMAREHITDLVNEIKAALAAMAWKSQRRLRSRNDVVQTCPFCSPQASLLCGH